MSTRAKSFHEILMPSQPLVHTGKYGAGVVVFDDSLRAIASLGHGLGPPLIEADSVSVAPSHEARHAPDNGHGEQRALERVVSDQPSELVPAQHHLAGEAADRDLRHAKRRGAIDHVERNDPSDREPRL